jgi:hypothetical protein
MHAVMLSLEQGSNEQGELKTDYKPRTSYMESRMGNTPLKELRHRIFKLFSIYQLKIDVQSGEQGKLDTERFKRAK